MNDDYNIPSDNGVEQLAAEPNNNISKNEFPKTSLILAIVSFVVSMLSLSTILFPELLDLVMLSNNSIGEAFFSILLGGSLIFIAPIALVVISIIFASKEIKDMRNAQGSTKTASVAVLTLIILSAAAVLLQRLLIHFYSNFYIY